MKLVKYLGLAASGVLAVSVFAHAATAASSVATVQTASSHLTREEVIDRVFTNVERRILKRYYETRYGDRARDTRSSGDKHVGMQKDKGKRKGMPPGLAKRGGDLPPGLAKRGGELPPGLAKRLPRDLESDLPRRSPNFWRVIVDNDIVLIDAATNKVLDVLEDVIRGKS